MRRANALMSLILAVLWLPVTMHCALEVMPGLEFLSCCGHEDTTPHEDNDCGADACAVVESGFYKLQDQEDVLCAVTELVISDARVTAFEPVVSATHPPLDLNAAWQFSFRAAPLPRAPSVLL